MRMSLPNSLDYLKDSIDKMTSRLSWRVQLRNILTTDGLMIETKHKMKKETDFLTNYLRMSKMSWWRVTFIRHSWKLTNSRFQWIVIIDILDMSGQKIWITGILWLSLWRTLSQWSLTKIKSYLMSLIHIWRYSLSWTTIMMLVLPSIMCKCSHWLLLMSWLGHMV